MENVTPERTRVAELIQFLCGRQATDEEIEAAGRSRFDFKYFRIQLLAGEECLERWPNIIAAWSKYATGEREIAESTYKMAHDLSLLRKDLDKVQASIDRFHPQVLEVLRSTEAISRLASAMKNIQAEIRSFGERASALEHKLSSYLADDPG